MENIKVFKISDTLNNKVNIEKLSLELKSSNISIKSKQKKYGEEIFVRYDVNITLDEEVILKNIIENHDGEDAKAFSEDSILNRETIIKEMNQLAIYHPLLDNIKTVEYLTSIDNYINAYIRSGINQVLINKIVEDISNPLWNEYLNTIVNDAGNKTYEYFISVIS